MDARIGALYSIPIGEEYGNGDARREVLEKIIAERNRHKSIGMKITHTPLQWLRIHAEELGEIAKELDKPDGIVGKPTEEELVQLAAAVVAHLEAILIMRRNAITTESGEADG